MDFVVCDFLIGVVEWMFDVVCEEEVGEGFVVGFDFGGCVVGEKIVVVDIGGRFKIDDVVGVFY